MGQLHTRHALGTIPIQSLYTLRAGAGLERSFPDFDGSLWEFVGPPPSSDEKGNPPKGFANPEDEGTMTVVAEDQAEFISSGGVVVRFRRDETSKVIRPCY